MAKSSSQLSDVLRVVRRILFPVATALLLIVGVSASRALAGDLSAQPADSLSVVGSTTSALPQYQPTQPEVAPGAAPVSATGGPAESSWQSRFHITGYLNQVFGMWLKPHGAQDSDRGAQQSVDRADPFSARRKLPIEREQFVLHARMADLRSAVFVEQRQQLLLLACESEKASRNCRCFGTTAQLRPLHERRIEPALRAA